MRVGEYKQDGILQLILAQYSVQFVLCLRRPSPIGTVNNEDQGLCVRQAASAWQRTDPVLSTDVPHKEVDGLGDGFVLK